MYNLTVKINGMSCSMCEAHINDVIRRNFKVKKVKSNHKKNITIILSEQAIDLNELAKVINDTGYEYIGVEKD